MAPFAPLHGDGEMPHKECMRPADHPEFFRFPAPEGRSRESTIRLDGEGRFWHEGELVDHPRLRDAMHTWIARHPDDGRYILTNGYDWTYFIVDDAPYFVVAVGDGGDTPLLQLSDATTEPFSPERVRIAETNALYTQVKAGAPGGPYEAKFTRHAQASLAPWVVDVDGAPALRIGERVVRIAEHARGEERPPAGNGARDNVGPVR